MKQTRNNLHTEPQHGSVNLLKPLMMVYKIYVKKDVIMSYIVNNEETRERMKEIDSIIEDSIDERKNEELTEEYEKLNDSIIRVSDLYEMICDRYDNVYYGQQGNGHYYTGSNTYEDYIYADGVVVFYTTINNNLQKAWIEEE